MKANENYREFAETVKELSVAPEGIPWPDRQALAKTLALAFASSDRSEAALRLAHILSNDPKWEVRKEVAEMLLLVPHSDFLKLTSKLSEDDNAFVRNAANRSLARRRQDRKETPRNQQGLNRLESEFSAMERIYGKLASDKARQMAERMYDILVGEVVHEMRGVLTPLKLTTQGLLKSVDDDAVRPKALREKLGRIRDRLAFLERLIDDMRNFSRALGKNRQPERLCDVVNEAHALTIERLHAFEKEIKPVKVQIAVPEEIVVEMARHQIAVALANILKNAIEAVLKRNNARVELNAKVKNSDSVEIVVQDNGPGRNATDLADLRDFVPGRTTMKNQGTGFGLPIARKNVLAHGGAFEVDSPRGRGFVVTITLPLRQSEDD